MAPSSKESLPKHPHLLVPACYACHKKKKSCVVTANAGNRNRSCDHCRRRHIKCITDEAEAGVCNGMKRRHADDGVDEVRKKQSLGRSGDVVRIQDAEKGTQKGRVKVEDRRDVLEVADASGDKSTRLETTLQELTQVITRNMTVISEERRERAECDRKTSETMNMMLKVMYKIMDASPLPSGSKDT
ncbi:hypothetical protein BKA82DRAFT_1004845 [Pisolithus tinctorius]|uniref:Zn(2)-C6 fungal-type domain-containing protein n=1 Tax=Pisolithus tinctorius Marx 270 TaxID=870435 RepID=A0A0C3NUR0_PISTI|nr:hypothetical protein BKA82DRAFT_1004845 [Pisolithus tinctorius]KIN99165.1 hypothetical protein M404DRAFT_1004845 [Pisolithus tinctorius Marx 270]